MAQKKTCSTGVRLTQDQMDKLMRIAESLRIKPTVAIGVLIDEAKIVDTRALDVTVDRYKVPV